MANIKFIQINNKLYSLRDFSTTYNLSYTTVRKYYHQGFRGNSLLRKAKEVAQTNFEVSNKQFKSKFEAAKYFQIPKSTFYRKLKNGTLKPEIMRCLNISK